MFYETSQVYLEKPWHRANDTDEGNERAKKAYRMLKTITLHRPSGQKYREFQRDVKRTAQPSYYDDNEEVSCKLLRIISMVGDTMSRPTC